MGDWVKIAVFSSRLSAEVAKSALETAGIDVLLQADDQGGMRPNFALSAGVKILVQQEDAADAKALLDEEKIELDNS